MNLQTKENVNQFCIPGVTISLPWVARSSGCQLCACAKFNVLVRCKTFLLRTRSPMLLCWDFQHGVWDLSLVTVVNGKPVIPNGYVQSSEACAQLTPVTSTWNNEIFTPGDNPLLFLTRYLGVSTVSNGSSQSTRVVTPGKI